MACWLVGIPFILFSSSVLGEYILVYLGGYPPTSGINFHTKWWEDNSQFHHWFLPHCWKKHISMCVPCLLPNWGQPRERLPSFEAPSAGVALPQGWKSTWRNPTSPILCLWAAPVLQENAFFWLLPVHPDLRGDSGFHRCWCPIASSSAPSASLSLCEGG